MWVIIDKRAPREVKDKLSEEFDIFEFSSSGITYEEVSGHPDIFIFQNDDKLIIAPNSPAELIEFFNRENINYEFGITNAGRNLASSTLYNAIESEEYFFHKDGYSDSKVIDSVKNKKKINLPQAYTRCSLCKLSNDSYITADKGISKILKKNNLDVLEIDDKEILLPGFKNGFFGGTNGIVNNTMYLMGSLKFHKDKDQIEAYLKSNNIVLKELYNGYLYDGGGLFFID